MTDEVATAREVVVHGLVQGVFFRASCAQEARVLGVRGWVRNEYDGSVRAHFEGTPDAVAAMVAWARHGPRHAVVQRVEEKAAEPRGLAGFEIH